MSNHDKSPLFYDQNETILAFEGQIRFRFQPLYHEVQESEKKSNYRFLHEALAHIHRAVYASKAEAVIYYDGSEASRVAISNLFFSYTGIVDRLKPGQGVVLYASNPDTPGLNYYVDAWHRIWGGIEWVRATDLQEAVDGILGDAEKVVAEVIPEWTTPFGPASKEDKS